MWRALRSSNCCGRDRREDWNEMVMAGHGEPVAGGGRIALPVHPTAAADGKEKFSEECSGRPHAWGNVVNCARRISKSLLPRLRICYLSRPMKRFQKYSAAPSMVSAEPSCCPKCAMPSGSRNSV